MLGTLAKWLRILGYDTVFDPDLDDHHLVRLARLENRVLLTRDRQLAQRHGVRVLLLTATNLDDQIRQVLAEHHLPGGADLDLLPARSLSRCPVCNEPLRALEYEAACARVPAYVAQTQDSFRHCPACARVYWPGTHWQRMSEYLAHLRAVGGPSGSVDSDKV